MLETILNINLVLIYFSGGLVAYFGLVELAKKKHKNYLLFILTLLISTVQIRYGLYLQGHVFSNPWYFFLHTTIIFTNGPIMLSVGFAMVDAALEKRYRLYLHLIPAMVVLIFEIIFYSQPMADIQTIISVSLKTFTFDWLNLGIVAASAHISIYSFYLVYMFWRINRQYELYQLKLVWVILIAPLFANLFIGLGFFLKSPESFHLGCFFISIVCLSFFFFTARYPGFFNSLISEIQSQRYKNTPLDSVDADAVKSRLEELMQQDQLYRDNELRVSDLAAELNLSTHQLSRILNETYEKNFNEFVNGYRISEAKNLLISRPEESVLDIAYMVGFNSKSTFNAQFQKMVHLSPVQFRDKMIR